MNGWIFLKVTFQIAGQINTTQSRQIQYGWTMEEEERPGSTKTYSSEETSEETTEESCE